MSERVIGGPRPLLNDDQMREWKRANMAVMDRLPENVRACIREIGLEIDCGKVQRALDVGMKSDDVCNYLEAMARNIKRGGDLAAMRSKMI